MKDVNTSFNREQLGRTSTGFLERLMNWTFPGAGLYYRDVELDENTIAKYEAGQIIRSNVFVYVSCFAGKPIKSCRFIIASSKAANIGALNPEVERWGMHIINVNSYFKVLDVYRKNGQTQVFLLHIPAKGIEVFKYSVFNFGEGDIEKQFIERARAGFDQRLEMPPAPELEEDGWLERTNYPVGLDADGQFLPLTPEFEIFNESSVLEMFVNILKLTNDNLELNLFPTLQQDHEQTESEAEKSSPAYSAILKVLAGAELDSDPPNYNKAFEYYMLAAEEGNDAEAQYNLGALYANGQGTEKNLLLAAYRFNQASGSNFHDAHTKMLQVTFMYFDENMDNWTTSELFQAVIEYFRILDGIENATTAAYTLIGEIGRYYMKEGKDASRALKCFQAIAEFGDNDNLTFRSNY